MLGNVGLDPTSCSLVGLITRGKDFGRHSGAFGRRLEETVFRTKVRQSAGSAGSGRHSRFMPADEERE